MTRAGREALTAYALVTPALLLFLVFFLFPVAHTAYLGLHEWTLASPPVWVGLSNYRSLATSLVFGEVVVNTALYAGATVALTLVGGLALALLLNRQGGLAGLLQGCIFTSYIVSWVAVSLLWVGLLDPQYGPISQATVWLGLPAVDWLGDPQVALWTLVGVTVWKTVGYDMVVFLAGLQAIPTELYEAAALDGAGPWARFRHITLPQLAPTVLFLTITSLIMTFQGFDVVRIMTQGGPLHSTTVYVYWVWEQAFQYFHMGPASAAVTVFFVVLLAITLAQFALFRRGRQGVES